MRKPVRILISHVVGRCPVCGLPILDNGKDDDPLNWQHSWAGWSGRYAV